MSERRSGEAIIVYTLYLLLGVLFLCPFVIMAIASVQDIPFFVLNRSFWTLEHWSLINWFYLIRDVVVIRAFLNTVFVSVVPVVIAVFINALLGYLFARKTFRGRDVLFWSFFAMMMVPSQLTLIPRFLLFNKLGWIDTYWVFIVPGMWSIAYVFLMRQFIKSIPYELDEAATIDGCGDFRIFRHMILPQVKAPMAAVGIFSFVNHWNDLMTPLIFTTSKSMRTLTLHFATLVGETGHFSQEMAAAAFNFIPTFLLFVLLQRYFVSGITLTGLKA